MSTANFVTFEQLEQVVNRAVKIAVDRSETRLRADLMSELKTAIQEQNEKIDQISSSIDRINRNIELILHQQQELKQEIHEVRQELKQEIQEVRLELKQEIQDVRQELKQEIQEVRQELKQEIQELRQELKQEIQEVRLELKQEIHEVRLMTLANQASIEELNKNFRRMSKDIRYLGLRLGEIADHIVLPGVIAQFADLGYNFEPDNILLRTIIKVKNEKETEVDILLENETTVIAVEVKSCPNKNDISKHKSRLFKIRQYLMNPDEKRKDKKLYGAVAALVFNKEPKEKAQQKGFYVLTQTGSAMKIEIPKDFVPKEF
jgi:DNA repair exonuclease SbcCD ATPase subunit